MAEKKNKTSPLKRIAPWLWIGAGGFLLLALLGMAGVLLFSGGSFRQDALDEGQRLEFSPITGEVEGHIITTAQLDGKEEEPPHEAPVEEEPRETMHSETGEEEIPDLAPLEEEGEMPMAEHEDVPADEEMAADEHETIMPHEEHKEEEAPSEPAHTVVHATPKEEKHETAHEPTAHADGHAQPSHTATTEHPSSGQEEYPIPRIASDGTKPWKHFAHGVSGYDGNEPRIAIILSGLGLGASTTEAAMALPHEISLSFSPYSRRIGQWSATAREKGHDVLLDLPMETERYPAMDPGPYGLLASLGAAENYERLTKIMTKTEGYVGMLTPLREVLTTNANVIAPVVDALSKHGLMLVSSTVEVPLPFSQISQKASVPVLSADLILDERIPESHIKQKLAQLEDLAQKQGYAIGIGRSFPVTVELVGIWAKSLQQKGIRLVPITALAE